jgi:hypothetical protein
MKIDEEELSSNLEILLDNPDHVDPLNPEINRMFFLDYFEK